MISRSGRPIPALIDNYDPSMAKLADTAWNYLNYGFHPSDAREMAMKVKPSQKHKGG